MSASIYSKAGADAAFATKATQAAVESGRLSSTTLDATYVSLTAAAKNPDLLIAGSITRDSNQAVTSAAVVWPDGKPGTFTALVLSTAFPGAVDSYKITYGSPIIKTFTQPTVTRNTVGAVTNVPQIVVS